MSTHALAHADLDLPVVPGIRSWLRRFPWPGHDPRHLGWSPAFEAYAGVEVRVALLDGGLDWELPVFRDALVLARDFTGNGDLSDPTGHGTTDASLLVGQPEAGFEGLIPGAELLFGRVLWPGGRGDSAGAVARGIRWATACGADIIVLPFGTARGSRLVAQAVAAAAKGGITIVASAGNRGPDEICFPAWLDEVVAVTGVDAAGRALDECCALDRADRAAPGEDVPAMGAHGPALVRGSSPATVIAAGLLALRQSAMRATSLQPLAGPVVGPMVRNVEPRPSM